jgi:membrane-bound serine protease (ClpP class)
VTGAHGLVGEMGTTLGALTPGEAGQIRVHGEIWRAVSPSAVAPGQRVVVTGVHGLTLSIEPAASTPEGASP